jgi:hypothetical protein
MAKKKPAAKMAAKTKATKPMAKKKPAVKAAPPKKKAPVKAAPKKEKTMAKKAPAKKATVSKKPAPKVAAAKKAPAKKVAAKPAKVAAKKTVAKVQPKSLKEKLLKTASKLVEKVAPKAAPAKLTKAQKEKELKEKKAAAAKAKAQAEADKKKAKEQEKKRKAEEKLQAKADKEAAKVAKKRGRPGKSQPEEEDEDEVFGAEPKRRDEEDTDEFAEIEEQYKKNKAAKKGGRKAYESDEIVDDLFVSKPGKKYNNAILADLESKIADEIAELREHFNWKDITDAIGTMDFFIDPKNDECIEKGCDNIRTTQSYCRLHYLRNWKTVQKKREILSEGKLQEYIEELISKYPNKYIEALLSDLSDDKEFYRVLNELNITSEFDFEEDEFDNAVDDDDADDDLAIETISSSLRYEDE